MSYADGGGLWQLSEAQRRMKRKPAADGVVGSRSLFLFRDNVAAVFLTVAFAGERRFQPALLAGRNIEGVTFDFTDDVFLLHLAFEPAERALQRLVVAQFDFCHSIFTCLSMIAIEANAQA
jgi:hypothetical protein